MTTTAIQTLVKASLEEYAEAEADADVPSHDELDHIESELTEAHGAVAAHTSLAESEPSEDDIEAMKDFIKSTAIRISELADNAAEAPTVVNASLEAAGEEHQKGLATRAIEALKRFFGNLIRHMTAFFGMLFGGLGRLEKKLVQLKQDAHAIRSDAKPKTAEITLTKAYLFGTSFHEMGQELNDGCKAFRNVAIAAHDAISSLKNGSYIVSEPHNQWPKGYGFKESSASASDNTGYNTTTHTTVTVWKYGRTSDNFNGKVVSVPTPLKTVILDICELSISLLNDIVKFGKEVETELQKAGSHIPITAGGDLRAKRAFISACMSNISSMNRVGYVVLNAAAKTIHSAVAAY